MINQNQTKLNNHKSIESEEALIASVITDSREIEKVNSIIKKDMFYSKFNQVLWDKIISMYRNGLKVDLTTVTSQLDNSNDTNIGDSPAFKITGYFNKMSTSTNAVQYAKNVYEKYELRNIEDLATQLKGSIGKDNIKTVDALTDVHKRISNVLSIHGDDKFHLRSAIEKAIQDMYNKDNTIQFGFPGLDNLIGGMRRGEITTIAGRPGHFKSTMAINIVHNLLSNGYKVLVFNREMKNESMLAKLIVADSEQIDYSRVVTGTYTEKDKKDIANTKEKLLKKYGKNLIMKDRSNDFESTVSTIRQVKPDVVVDDYIGLATLRNVEDPRLRIDNIMKEYKMLCKAYDMSALIVSQLNRKCEERTNKRPIPSDLRESGSIEQDSETLLFMFYEYRYLQDGSKNGEFGIDVVVGKNRYGKTGTVELGVVGERCKIYDHHSIALAEKYEIEEKSNE